MRVFYQWTDEPLFHCWIKIDEVPAHSAGPNTTKWHQSKVTAELWHRLFMSETSLNIHNPGGIRRGLARQNRDINLHSVRLYPSLLSPHRPPSISPLCSVAVFTLQCRNSGPKMETQNAWKTLLHSLYPRHGSFYLIYCLLCKNISSSTFTDSLCQTFRSEVLLLLQR